MSFSCCATAKPNVMNIAINKTPTEEDIINQVTQVKSKKRYDTKDTGTDRNGRRNETNKYLEYLLPFFHNLYDKIAEVSNNNKKGIVKNFIWIIPGPPRSGG